jgi:hypothetical protein
VEPVTFLDVAFRYSRPPGETELRALDDVREVYGIRAISFDEGQRIIRVEYDASRLSDDDIGFLLRNAGIDVREKAPLLEHPEFHRAA